jgi:hypothetical protein
MERWADKNFLDGLTPEVLGECVEGYLRELGLKRCFGPVYRYLEMFKKSKGNIEGKRFTNALFYLRDDLEGAIFCILRWKKFEVAEKVIVNCLVPVYNLQFHYIYYNKIHEKGEDNLWGEMNYYFRNFLRI